MNKTVKWGIGTAITVLILSTVFMLAWADSEEKYAGSVQAMYQAAMDEEQTDDHFDTWKGTDSGETLVISNLPCGGRSPKNLLLGYVGAANELGMEKGCWRYSNNQVQMIIGKTGKIYMVDPEKFQFSFAQRKGEMK